MLLHVASGVCDMYALQYCAHHKKITKNSTSSLLICI